MEISKQKISDVLQSIVPAEKISGIVINGANVGFALESSDENLRKAAEKAVFAISGVEKVTAVLTGATGNISVENKGAQVLNRKQALPGVKRIIAVASGKGGVGKSTIALALARAAEKSGLKTAIVDADIYGPSLAHMLDLKAKPAVVDNLMIPIEAEGIFCNSMGLLLGDDQPAIWRGPMATKAIHQLFTGTNWATNGEIDVLFIDMPPGTGDIHLTIAQHYQIDGAVIVTTPQELALLDVKKAVSMFARVGIKILGVVENMSYFADPITGAKSYIFGKDGGKDLAAQLQLPLLAQVPIGSDIDLAAVVKDLL
jgi:ATP-binding protein involved in chromosome partitioning